MPSFITFLIVSFVVVSAAAQPIASPRDSLEHEKFLTLVNANREQSYFTFGNGIGNLEPLLFEAKLSPSYFFSRSQRKWALMINPQVQIRMLNKRSLPIRNPSYRVYITYFQELGFWKKSFLRKLFYDNAVFFGSVAHHSNGQDGDFYKDEITREINEDANFSTNFLEAGISSYRIIALRQNHFSIREIKVSFEYHPQKWMANELADLYGAYRFYATFGLMGPREVIENRATLIQWLQQSSIEMKTGWIFGNMQNAGFAEASRRLVIDITYKYYPKWFDEIAFFVRFYRGQDYYNIHFINTELTNLSIGITSNIMNFQEVVKLFNEKK
jgi:hypothetical protein